MRPPVRRSPVLPTRVLILAWSLLPACGIDNLLGGGAGEKPPGGDEDSADGGVDTAGHETAETGTDTTDSGPDEETGIPLDPPAPDIPCPTDVLDATPCAEGVAAWNTTTERAYPDIQEAIDAAHDSDTVVVCEGRWRGGFDVPVTSLTLRGYGTDTTTLDGAGLSPVLTVREGARLTVQDLAITRGQGGLGGGISAPSADLLTCEVWFSNNAASEGAGVYLQHGTWLGRGLLFETNVASLDAGGAKVYDATATLVDATFTGNVAVSDAGALHVSTGIYEIWDTSLRDNEAGYEGGGMTVSNSGGDTTVRLTRTEVSANSAGYGGGGLRVAVSSNAAMSVVLDTCTFSDNHADYEGGGLNGGGWSDLFLSVVNSTFVGNSSHSGGAFFLGDWAPIHAEVTDSVIDGNNAAVGGAFSTEDGGGAASLFVTGGAVTSNVADNGGGVDLDEDCDLTVTSSDWGSGATENQPDDVLGYSFGADATFSCADQLCE